MLKEKFQQRFIELEEAFGKMPYESGAMGKHVPNGEWRKWATSAQSLIAAAFGSASFQSKNFNDLYEKCKGFAAEVKGLDAVFQSSKDDYLGGYVFDVELRVSGEVFGDFVALARQALSEGKKDVAAVLACAALEDALKRYATVNDLDVSGKAMSEVINALKVGGFVSGAQKSILEAMPRVRNAALHAEWTKISEPDVSSVIGFVEQFLLTKFSAD